jgi:hypothetical protein
VQVQVRSGGGDSTHVPDMASLTQPENLTLTHFTPHIIESSKRLYILIIIVDMEYHPQNIKTEFDVIA